MARLAAGQAAVLQHQLDRGWHSTHCRCYYPRTARRATCEQEVQQNLYQHPMLAVLWELRQEALELEALALEELLSAQLARQQEGRPFRGHSAWGVELLVRYYRGLDERSWAPGVL